MLLLQEIISFPTIVNSVMNFFLNLKTPIQQNCIQADNFFSSNDNIDLKFDVHFCLPRKNHYTF